MTAVSGASTLGLPAATPNPSRDANYHINDDLIISAEPTGCNPRTVLQFPSIFNPAFGGALDAVATPHNLRPPMAKRSSISRWCVRRKMSATTEGEARTIRSK
jgi:hypothetical protein